jgi:hypothetical protein
MICAYTSSVGGSGDNAASLVTASLAHTLIFSILFCNASLDPDTPSINPFLTNATNSRKNAVAAPRSRDKRTKCLNQSAHLPLSDAFAAVREESGQSSDKARDISATGQLTKVTLEVNSLCP